MGKKGERKPRIPDGDRTDPQGMAALCHAYLEWGQVHNYSDHTINHQLRYLNAFIAWASDRGLLRPGEVTKAILERYQRWLFHYRKEDGDPLSFATQKAYLVPVRMWFKWLARHNHILYNPASELELPKPCRTLPRNILTASEAELVMNQPDVHDTLGLRDRAILETFYSTGMRRVELSNLTLYDIDRERGTVLVNQGKGKKDRIIPIGDRALAWVEKYKQESRPKLLVGGKPTDLLFLTHFGEAFTLDRLSQMVQQYIAAADLGKQGSCHMFRHTMATLMLENGCDLRFIQMMLGHANLSTTQIYTQVSIKKLVEMHRATHPARLERSPGEAADVQ
jgi:integrase/recombinase XerD